MDTKVQNNQQNSDNQNNPVQVMYDAMILQGFITPEIEQFFNDLRKNEANFTEVLNSELLQKQIITFTQKQKNYLPGYFLLTLLLEDNVFPDVTVHIIGENIFKYLEQCYTKEITTNEHDHDTRSSAWNILSRILLQLNTELKGKIKNLAMKADQNPTESTFIKSYYLQGIK